MNRRLWIDTRGIPVITTTSNGVKNAIHWGWTPATARPLPTREEIADAISNATDDGANTTADYADVVLALLKGQDA